MTAQEALVAAIRRLKIAGIPDASTDARILLAYALGLSRDRLTLHQMDALSEEQALKFNAAIAAREARQPVSQIIGSRAFYGRDFIVTPDVLDPRPETETLILEALKQEFTSVLDLGTGSGCILLTLLAERPAVKGVGADISSDALAIARNNANRLEIVQRATFIQSDWFSDIEGSYDLIVSNPPYIDADEWETLDPEPRNWEPKIALTPGADGLEPYRVLAKGAPAHLNPDGWLIVEIGWRQGKAVSEIFRICGFKDVEVLPDLDERDRIVKGRI